MTPVIARKGRTGSLVRQFGVAELPGDTSVRKLTGPMLMFAQPSDYAAEGYRVLWTPQHTAQPA
jgi:hypothetical protein